MSAFLSFQGISKSFPGVQALSDVSFEVQRGSCHALMGENGAGKSTLGKILAGIYQADAGGIELEGRPIRAANPLQARGLGIAMVHQELAFCPNLSIAENLCLGDLPSRSGWLDRGSLAGRARRMLSEIGVEMDVRRPIGELSTGQEQMVQIAAAVGTGARVVVMDEPTSSLSAHESARLFDLLAHLKERGITVLYVSHRMDEIFRLCDTLTVLRDGKHVSTGRVAELTPDAVVRQMIGRDVVSRERRHVTLALGEERLRVENLSVPGRVEPLSFSVRAGEIVGFAGLVGAGRSEMAVGVAGLDPSVEGEVWVDGKRMPSGSARAVFDAGLGFLPEDRKRLGLVLSMNCRENASLASLEDLSRFGFLNRAEEGAWVSRAAERLRVKTPSYEYPVAGLSGGNQQKVALAKWLARSCKVLIVDEPTRGVDVGAKAEIHALLDELACQGLAIVLISSELPELLDLSRRVLVMREGRVVGEVARGEFSEERIVRLMAGVG